MHDMTREELLSAYLDEELSADDRSLVDRMLGEDEAYRRLAEELRADRRHLAAIPHAALGDEFLERVWSRIEQARPGGAPGLTRPSLRVASSAAPPPAAAIGKWVAWPLAAAAAGLLLLVSQRSGLEPGHSELARRHAPPVAARSDRLHRAENLGESAGEPIFMAPRDTSAYAGQGDAAGAPPASLVPGNRDVATNVADAHVPSFMDAPLSSSGPIQRELDRRFGAPTRAQAKALKLLPADQAAAAMGNLEMASRQSGVAGMPPEEMHDAIKRLEKVPEVEIPRAAPADDSPVVVVNVAVSSLRDGIPALKSALGRQDILVEDVAESLVLAADALRKSPGAPPDGPPTTPRLPYVVEGVTLSQIHGALRELQSNRREVQRVEVIQDGSDAASNVRWNRLVQEQEVDLQDRLAPGIAETTGATVRLTPRDLGPNKALADGRPEPARAPREEDRRQFLGGRNRVFQGGYGGIRSASTPQAETPEERALGMRGGRKSPDGDLKAVFLLEAISSADPVPVAPIPASRQ